jgi:RHS repeat-associated protein
LFRPAAPQDAADQVPIDEYYSYDAYGVVLSGNPTPANPAATNLLYTGEQWDTSAQSYYLRARYYDPLNGRFNRTDPYPGNAHDPQSLHKYLCCHANPVNGLDPTRYSDFSLVGLVNNIAIRVLCFWMCHGSAILSAVRMAVILPGQPMPFPVWLWL